MTFIVRMALREVRASWQRLLFFFICIAIGVASIVAIRSVIQSVGMVLTSEARALLAADMMVRSNSPFTPVVHETLAREQLAGRITAQSEAIEIDTMVRTDAATPVTRMIELRAVQEAFPFHGTLTLREGTYSHALLRNGGALIRPELMAQLHVAVGDDILIGARPFEVRGVIASEPGRSLGVFTLGPRVFIDHADLPSTGLLTFGSDVDYEMLLKVPDEALGPLTDDLEAAFANEYVGIRSYRRRQDRMAENLIRTENYLSLVGLVVLLLGGIGVSSVTRVFIQQKIRSIAILKCVGSTSRQILAIYLTQVVLLGLAGSALGVALAGAIIAAFPLLLSGAATVLLQVDIGLTRGAVAQGVAVGLLVSLLFSLVPLLEVRRIKPALLLREDSSAALRRFDWVKWVVMTTVAAALVAVASWQAGSLETGLLLTCGLVAVAFVLDLAGFALVRAVRPLRRSPSFALRHAVLHVTRPGNQTRAILLAVGLGTFFILTVQGIQVNLLRDFSVQLGENAPDTFLLDVQDDQRPGLNELLDREAGDPGALRYIPVLRARIVGVRGRDVSLDSYEEVRGRGGLSREFTVTYRPNLEANEQLVDGEWWEGPSEEGEAEVSIEESLQRRFDIQLGDEIRFDVLGRIVAARVTSFREVDFRDFRAGGFVIVFRPGTFDKAPHSFIASLKGSRDVVARARMQGAIVARYPNVSVIDLREILDAIQKIVNTISPAVSAIGALVLLSGSLILVGAVSMTKFRRVYEAAILKTLGANSRLIAAMLLLEYGVLGAIAGTIGAFGATILSWAAARYVLDLNWQASPRITVSGIGATTVLVAAIGVLASLDVLRHKPLATLRAE